LEQLNADPLGGGRNKQLNWEALGAIGELIGAAAVLVTLIYLAQQMRQNTKAVRIAARTTIQEAFSEFGGLLASSPEMAELYLKGCEDYRALSKTDRLRFSNLLQTYVYSIEMLNQLASEQAIDTGLTGHPLERLQWLFRQPGVRDWWGQNSGLFGSAFVDTVESVVAGIPHDE
jgi:hypothetical protein